MNCTGKPCSKVTFELESMDPTLTYEYKSISSKATTGTLGDDEIRYKGMWLSSFMFWMGFGFFPGFSPFQNVKPSCEEGCECDLGPEVVNSKEYTYAPTFQLKNSTIKISGKFTMKVTTQTGVCTPKAGTKFSLVPKEGDEMLAMMSPFEGELEPPTDVS